MQVKKFEAPTMKEALDLIKAELGPDAIILSAKDHKSSFGLLGKNSIEVAAAVSETQLARKRATEARLNQEYRGKFSAASARVQKDLIKRTFQRPVEEEKGAVNRPLTARSYIDITDEDQGPQFVEEVKQETVEVARPKPQKTFGSVRPEVDFVPSASRSSQESVSNQEIKVSKRVSEATQIAAQALMGVEDTTPSRVSPPAKSMNLTKDREVIELKQQVEALKSAISAIKDVPNQSSGTFAGAEYGLPYELGDMFERLCMAGLSAGLAGEILRICHEQLGREKSKRPAIVKGWLAKYILDDIKIAESISKNQIHLFLGPTGSGKTSSIVKFAANILFSGKGLPAIVCADTKKVGAIEQMRTYSQILNLPFAVVQSQSDWERVIRELPENAIALVDLPGTNLSAPGDYDMLENLMPKGARCKTHYVQPCPVRVGEAKSLLQKYLKYTIDDLIFTKLDETSAHGIIYDIQKEFGLPLHSFGIGTEIPEDFEFATKERVLDLILKISKNDIGHGRGVR